MSLKSLACVSMAALGLMFSATSAPAQSWWNPLNAFSGGRPAYGSQGYGAGYNGGMSCRNGVCTPRRTNYGSAYAPNYGSAYGSNYGAANCPNGICATANCPNGNCGVSQCGPGGCGVNSNFYGSNGYRNPGIVPPMNYRSNPGYFESRRVPVSRSTNFYTPTRGRTGATPFYP